MIRYLIDAGLRRAAVRENVRYGSRFHVGFGSVLWAPRKLTIGNDVYVGKNVTIQVDGIIGDNVLIANSVGIVGRTDHEIKTVGTPVRSGPWVGDFPDDMSHKTTIGSDVWIGYGAIIMSGVRIGNSSIIAAGSIVTHDVPDNSIVAGTAATVLRNRFPGEDFLAHKTQLLNAGIRMIEGTSNS